MDRNGAPTRRGEDADRGDAPAPGAPGRRRRDAGRPRHVLATRETPTRPRQGRRGLIAGLVVALAVTVTAAGVVASRLASPLGALRVRLAPELEAQIVTAVGRRPLRIAWPAARQVAVRVPLTGFALQSGPERPAPIASTTKIMTGYLTLLEHPLAPGEAGPSLVVSAADVTLWQQDVGLDESNVEVVAGERLSERQLLEGLLVHSANNFATMLAEWDAGSLGRFVARMNAEAHRLGMDHTHYVDASGFDSGSVSTAADLLRVAGLAMANPVFASIVRRPEVSLPVVGEVSSYTPLVGSDDVVGVKSGFTGVAGLCDVLALAVRVGGEPVDVLVAVLGSGGETLATTGADALGVARAVAAELRVERAGAAGEPAGVARFWGQQVPVVTAAPARLVVVAGQQVLRSTTLGAKLHPGARPGALVGRTVLRVGDEQVVVPLVLAAGVRRPGFWARLGH